MNFTDMLLTVVILLCCSDVEAINVKPVSGVHAFDQAGVLMTGVSFAPLAVTVDLSRIETMTKDFRNITLKAAENMTLLPKQALQDFARQPFEQCEEMLGMLEANAHAHRQTRQIMSTVSVGLSAWSLARTFQLESTVDKLASNQEKVAGTVDWIATHIQDEDKLTNDLVTSVNTMAMHQHSLLALVGEYGYFSEARAFSRRIDKLHTGVRQLMSGKLSSDLVSPHCLKQAYVEMARQASKQGLKPVFQQWQQTLVQESMFVYKAGVLTAVAYIPFTHVDNEETLLWNYQPTAWQHNKSVLIFRPQQELLVTDLASQPLARLPNSFLIGCRKQGAFHLCAQPMAKTHGLEGCLVDLFNGKMHRAVDSCPIHYLPKVMHFHAVNTTSMVVYSPEKIDILETCPDKSTPDMAVFKGLNWIQSNHGCVVKTGSFSLTMGGETGLEISIRIKITPLSKMALGVDWKIPRLNPIKELPVEKIHEEMKEVEDNDEWLQDRDKMWTVVGIVIAAILALGLILYCLRGYCGPKAVINRLLTSIFSTQEPEHQPGVSFQELLRNQVQDYLASQGWANEEQEDYPAVD